MYRQAAPFFVNPQPFILLVAREAATCIKRVDKS